MKFLITGGCGFIGSYLCESLISKGHFVEIIDNLSTGTLDNISHLSDHKRLSLIIDTISNYPIIEKLVGRNDFVFHLAAAVGVKKVIDDPIGSIMTNVDGTHNMLKACAKHNKRILITSTSEVYGKNKNVPFSEDADIVIGTPQKRRWSYACTKALDEFLTLAYFQEKQVQAIIVRLFNTVGPRQSERYGMVIPRFIKQALSNKPITVFGDGMQTRCFIHVKDVVSTLLMLIDQPEAYGKILNIGSSDEISIKKLASIVKNLSKSSSPIININPEEIYKTGFEDMRRRIPDTTRIKEIVPFSPKLNIEDIVRGTIEYQMLKGL